MSLFEQLRALPTMIRPLPQEEPYLFSLLPSGMPKSGLVELCGTIGAGKTEVILRFLNENPNLEVAWIEKDFTIYPGAFPHYQVSLDRILFIDVSSPRFKQTPFWCASQVVKSQLFQAVIFFQIEFTEIELRRLQLLAKQAGTLIIFLRTHRLREKNWCVTLQIQVSRSECSGPPILTILKSKNRAHGLP